MLLGAWGTKSSATSSGGGGNADLGGGVSTSVSPNPGTTPVMPPSAHHHLPPFEGIGAGLQRSNSTTNRRGIRYFALITLFALYLTLGAAIFSSIEAPTMEAIANHVDQLRGKFLQRHPSVKGECEKRGV